MSLYTLILSVGTLLIMVTCFGRLNDIGPAQKGALWWTRRLSLVVLIGACAMVFASPFTLNVPNWAALTRAAFVWGMAGVMVTSPNQKPWWTLLTGAHREPGMSRRERLLADAKAIRNGFSRGDRRHCVERRSGVDRRKGA